MLINRGLFTKLCIGVLYAVLGSFILKFGYYMRVLWNFTICSQYECCKNGVLPPRTTFFGIFKISVSRRDLLLVGPRKNLSFEMGLLGVF